VVRLSLAVAIVAHPVRPWIGTAVALILARGCFWGGLSSTAALDGRRSGGTIPR
jgi:hypothetical protein